MTVPASVFDDAARSIEEHGWWSTTMPTNDERSDAQCIGNATTFAAKRAGADQIEANNMLLKHFGFTDLFQVYELNDSQPLDAGKEWAITELRKIAEKIRERNPGMAITTKDITITEESTVDEQVEVRFGDSTGAPIKQGDYVKVSDAEVADGRTYDVGEVDSLNENGTVAVGWSLAGCSCMGTANEKTSALTLSNSKEYNDFVYGNPESDDYDTYYEDEDDF